MNEQLPLPGLAFTSLGSNRYTLSSSVSPMVQVRYRDGNNTLRAKLVQAPMQLTGTVTSLVDPGTVHWWAHMLSGSISNLMLSGTTLSFAATAAIDVIAIPSMPDNFPVLRDFTCAQQPPVRATCRGIYPLESYCQLSSFLPGASTIAIPFEPLGTPPYINPIATSLGGVPYVLRVLQLPLETTMIDLAFPITLSYLDGTIQIQTQSTVLLMSLLMQGIADVPGTRIIADLSVPNIIPAVTATPPALTVQSVFLSGRIAALGESAQVLVTDAVQCGEAPVAVCQPIIPPPTAEITG